MIDMMRRITLSSKGLMSLLLLASFLFTQCKKDEALEPVNSTEVEKTAYTSSNSVLKVINLSKVTKDSGYGYHIFDWFGVGGDTQWSKGSTLRIFENGKELGPAHTPRADVISQGKGKFSHFGNNLYFSASDNTDPRTNGRSYTYTTSTSYQSSVIESSLVEASPVETSAGETTSTAPATAKPLNMSRVTASSGNEYQIFDWFGVGGDTQWSKSSPLKIFENGREIGPAHSSRSDIAAHGKGRFSHWGNNLYFSSSDNTDPRTNGRKYTYTIDGSTSTVTSPGTAPTSPAPAPTSPAPAPAPIVDGQQRVIFDTDPGGDVDDAGALAVLHALADRGEVKILAMGVVIGHDLAVPYVDAINTWYGRPDIPVGTIKTSAPYSSDYFMRSVVDRYPSNLTKASAPDVVDLYRKVLAAQPDKSVTLIAVGPSTNIKNLLKSGPDHHSSLSGVELVRRKVKFYAAGGNGNGGLPYGQSGFNYYMDLSSASTELSLLPSDFPTVFAGGSGSKLEIGSELNQTRYDHIIRKSYESYFKGVAKNRATWDQLRVLYACRPSARAYFNTSAPGKIQVNSSRIISYSASSEKNQAYAYVNNIQRVKEELLKLMLHDSRG